jgi:hypothetical protein
MKTTARMISNERIKYFSLSCVIYFFVSYYNRTLADYLLFGISIVIMIMLKQIKSEKENSYINNIITDANTKRVLITASLIHSIIHRIWPFLSFEGDGYIKEISTQNDLLFHLFFLLLTIYYSEHIPIKDKLASNIYNSYKYLCIVGGLVNIYCLRYEQTEDHNIFLWSTLGTTIGCAYFFHFCLFLHESEDNKKINGLIASATFTIFVWALMKMDDDITVFLSKCGLIDAYFVFAAWLI